MAAYIDQQGATQQVTLDPSIYRDAKASNLSVEALINQRHPVRAGERSAFEQLCAPEGMFIGRNSAFGIRPATMESILNGPSIEAASIVRDAVPASRILFPAFQLAAIEDKLRANDYGIISQFEGAASVTDT